jgi:hypothetical protein
MEGQFDDKSNAAVLTVCLRNQDKGDGSHSDLFRSNGEQMSFASA